MYDITPLPINRVAIVTGLILNEAVARGHKENGSGYIPISRLMSLLMEINEEVIREVNERMNKILIAEVKRAKLIKQTMGSVTTA